jgi:hypothetical protein
MKALITLWLCAAAACARSAHADAGTGAGAGTGTDGSAAHTLKLGWNVGYLSDSQYYHKAFRRLGLDGHITHTRFMGPFLHPPGHAQDRREEFAAGLIHNISAAVGEQSTITLTLSDFPFDVVPDFLEDPSKYLSNWVGKPSNASLADTLRYSKHTTQSVSCV